MARSLPGYAQKKLNSLRRALEQGSGIEIVAIRTRAVLVHKPGTANGADWLEELLGPDLSCMAVAALHEQSRPVTKVVAAEPSDPEEPRARRRKPRHT